MFQLPGNFEWLPPWGPLHSEDDALQFGRFQAEIESGETIATRLVDELRREMPDGHQLASCRLRAIGQCHSDPNEFLFATDDPGRPLAVVHLTWREETDPTWPYTVCYLDTDDWIAQMRREGAPNPPPDDANG